MIGILAKTGFTPREFFEMTFGILGSALLQALTQGMMSFAVPLNSLTAEGLAFAIGCQVDDAQINAQCPIRCTGRGLWHFQRDCQREDAITVKQISLPLDPIHASFLIATNTERNKDTSSECDQGNRVQTFERHDTWIIDNSALWPKGWLDALVTLIGFTGLTDGPNSQLSRKLVGATQFAIHHLLQFKLVGGLCAKSHACHVVSSLVKGVHGFKQGAVLFFRWSKLQEQRLFHAPSLSPLNDSVNRQAVPTTLAPNK